MRWCYLVLLSIGCFWGCWSVPGYANDWPQFRGPTQQGHSPARHVPTSWSDTENIAWKTSILGRGWSSPTITGSRIWLTTAIDDGHSLRALCVDRHTGHIVHDIEVFHKDQPGSIHPKNSHASPSPLIVGDRVFLHFGRHGTACLTTTGKIVWRTELDYAHRHGPGGSPALFEDLLIINCDGTDRQFTVALDTTSGREVWRRYREGGRMAYSTPLVIDHDGSPQVICCCGEWTVAYHPRTGEELWRFRYPGGYSNVPRPVIGFGMTFVSSGYDTPTFYAIPLHRRGEIPTEDAVWRLSRGAPRNASPLLVGNELYLISDNGIATCVDARTGEVYWQERLGGDFSASPIYVEDKIYCLNESGTTYILAPGRNYHLIRENQITGRTLASLAPADGALYLRTEDALYCISEQTNQAK